MLQLMKQQNDTQQAIASSLATLGPRGESASGIDKVANLTGIKVELTYPKLYDSNKEYFQHWNKFLAVMQGQAAGRAIVRPQDMLICYRKCLLPENGIRAKEYDLI